MNVQIKAKYVVIATKYPIINFPGFHFLKMYQSTSYIIAIETNSKLPQGMYIVNTLGVAKMMIKE